MRAQDVAPPRRSWPARTSEGGRRLFGLVGRSVRLRLVVPLFLLLLVAGATAMVAVRALLLNEMDARLQLAITEEIGEFDRLRQSIDKEGATLEVEDTLPALFDTYLEVDPPPSSQQNVTLIGSEVYRTRGADGTGYDLTSDPSLVRSWAATTQLTYGETTTPRGVVRYLVRPVTLDGQQGRMVAAIFIDRDRREIDKAIRIAAAVIFGFLALGTLFTYAVSGRVVSPLKRLTATARRITDTDLSQRIAVRGGDEVADLGRTFNQMLERLDQAFTAQRRLLRDVGHELRTPLAIATGYLEFVDRDDANREALEIVDAEHQRMRHLIDDLLVLARSEHRDFLQLETVDLAGFTAALVDRSRALADRTWTLENEEAGKVVADPQRLTQALGNLVDNAVRHTGPGGLVTIGARCRGGLAMLWVADDGPGVPVAERERIFWAFERGIGENPGTGTGLGLAIAHRIADAHHGTIRVTGSAAGGARFEITFPIDPPENPEDS